MATWADPYIVGEGAKLNNGYETIDASKSLANFASYMKGIESSLPFTYDIAAAFYKWGKRQNLREEPKKV